ncbi:class C beta-lactamase-related serine hydrolase [Sphingomonas gilva]|uniref:Class C beta-lactamase-related serine hydrolase n=1 Tax=Sphingomonas gilva TaxID=2305907 RepID=A0A396RUE2_9SPHN|nr:serine hydrolase [Sphingomonas gilva]RHW19072.1 class C beta-lactamase-related serine hydrolase [Sphingomonas gilva]
MRYLLPVLGLAACAPVERSPPPPAGVATAWAAFDAQTVRESGATGQADRAAARALTIDDPVRVASISKLVVALGVMRLVEAGRLDLDEDVSEKLGWSLRNPAFPDKPITLRLLLSHRSSLKDDGEAYIIPIGQTVRDRMRDPASFDAQHPPGSYFRYANINFPVIATVMEKATGERFDRLIHAQAIAPLGLDACFNWTMCSDAAVARAVVLYDTDGSVRLDDLGGRRPPCPVYSTPAGGCDLAGYVPGTNGGLFSPQGGLRISARGLATIGRLLVNRGVHDGERFLSEASIDAILSPAWRFDGGNGETDQGFYCAYGLASQSLPVPVKGCNDDLFAGRAMAGHAGSAYGLRSGLWIDPKTRTGIAFFATSNGADPPRGRSAYTLIEERLAANLGR